MNPGVSLELLAGLQPVSVLSRELLQQIAGQCQLEHYPGDAEVAAPGLWQGQEVFMLKGEMELQLADGSVRRFSGEGPEARHSIKPGPRAIASARTLTPVSLLRFDSELLDVMLTWDQLTGGVRSLPEAEPSPTQWQTMTGVFAYQSLRRGVFSNLPAAHIGELLRRLERIRVTRGQVILTQGEPGDHYYVIERGRVQVTRELGGAAVELAELSSGQAFGEEALISGGKRNATVVMLTDGMLLRLHKDDFVKLLQAPLLEYVSPALARRRVEAGAQWLDVRYPSEFRYDGLPDGLNVPINELRDALPTLDRNREFITYCASGRRSAAAAFLLCQSGFRAAVLAGGLKAMNGGGG